MEETSQPARSPSPIRKRIAIGLAAAALFGSGLAVGAAVTHSRRPLVAMAPRAATPLQRLATPATFLPAEAITVTGRIVEKSEGCIVLQDASGKASLRLGRRGPAADMLAVGATISVQGLVGPDGLEPAFLILPDNRVIALHRGHGGRGHHRGSDRRGTVQPIATAS